MLSLPQKWRRLLRSGPNTWSEAELLSATAHSIARQLNLDIQSLMPRHDWLRPTGPWQSDIKAPIAALGWVYQLCNDPRRQQMDKILQQKGQIGVDLIACKTQIFTPEARAKSMAQLTLGHFFHSRAYPLPFESPYPIETNQEAQPIHPSEITILDPACGTGILLLEAAKVLHLFWQQYAAEHKMSFDSAAAMSHILKHQIQGCDIASWPLALTKLSLDFLACQYGASPSSPKLHLLSPTTLGALNPDIHLACLQAESQDIVLLNPPYQNSRKIKNTPLKKWYPESYTDLYGAFMQQAIRWLKPGGCAGLLTMHTWLFLRQHQALRHWLLSNAQLKLIEQHTSSDFEGIQGEITQSAFSLWTKSQPDRAKSIGVTADGVMHRFDPKDFESLPQNKLLFWWPPQKLKTYQNQPKLADVAPARQGLATGNNTRFLRYVWEVEPHTIGRFPSDDCRWLPYSKGASGRAWFTPLETVIHWPHQGWHKKTYGHTFGSRGGNGCPNIAYYGRSGIAYAKIGHRFSAREILRPGVVGNAGSAIFPPKDRIPELLALLNHPKSQAFLSALNPSVNFTESDVNALPIFDIPYATELYQTLHKAYVEYSGACETSLDFQAPQPNRWGAAQAWAHACLENDGLTDFKAPMIPPSEESQMAYALGVILGRFQARPPVIKPQLACIVRQKGDDDLNRAEYRSFFEEIGICVNQMRAYLWETFFKAHLKTYHGHPVYWPLGNRKTRFVIWINAHKADKAVIDDAIKRCSTFPLNRDENSYLQSLKQLVQEGPPSTTEIPVERPMPYQLHLEDGLLCQAARLWPAFAFRWTAPELRWRSMFAQDGRRSFGWSRSFQDFWPERYRHLCRIDPSLAHAPPEEDRTK